MLRYLTAGESHGKCLVGILEGLPAGLMISKKQIDQELARRQKGYGRGGRMKIEKDKVEILSGVRKDKTIGSPVSLLIKNKDFKINSLPAVSSPRPGHADLAGALKYNTKDIRNILERASARETAMRVAIGAVSKALLHEFKIKLTSHVVSIGKACMCHTSVSFNQLCKRVEKSSLRCVDKDTELAMIVEIDKAKREGDSLGGIFEVIAINLPTGLGSYVDWQRRLDARIAAGCMSVPAVKSVEIGAGICAAANRGSEVHDAIFYSKQGGFFRKTNTAGGLEGGVTNGEPLLVRCAMKPIATLSKPLQSVNVNSKRVSSAAVERADTCAVPAAAVVAEAMVAFCLAEALLEKFGGDSMDELRRNYHRTS